MKKFGGLVITIALALSIVTPAITTDLPADNVVKLSTGIVVPW